MKILIVDDVPEKVSEVKKLLQSVVERADDHIVVADSGLEAREHLARTQYDLLVLDIKLPLRSGDEPDRRGGIALLTEITLSDRFVRPTHVVALTGFADLRKEFEAKFNNGQWTVETYDPSDVGWRERLKAKAIYIQKTLQQTGHKYQTDLCVLVALNAPELDAIRSLQWNWSEAEMLDSVSFLYRGQYTCEGATFSVVAAAAPRIGMVAASTLTQKIVYQLRPRVLAMTGICAGVRDACNLGDILLADPCWDWQMGKYLKETFEIAPDQLQVPLEISQRMSLLRQDRQLLIDLSEAYKAEKPNHIPCVLIGAVASGSAVLADETTVETIKGQHRNLLGVDMELYGVYSAVRDSCAPRPLVFGLKGVCDFADHLKNDKYQKYAAYMSAQILRHFMERYSISLFAEPVAGATKHNRF